jgi:hypothetical protein
MPTMNRAKPLSDAEKREFFEPHGHLAYRYTMLWTHKLRFPKHHGIEHCHAICAFEASLVACRVFMEFLGLGIDRRPGKPILCERQEYSKPDDVKVKDLGGSFVTLLDVGGDKRDVLAEVYHLADKASAHFTYGASFMEGEGVVHAAIPEIDRLLRKNLYDVLGELPRGHWFDPQLASVSR